MKQETVILNVLANMTGAQLYELSRKLAWYAPAASEEFEFNLALNNRERIEQAKKEAEFFVEKLNVAA